MDIIAKGDVKTFSDPDFPAGEARGFGFPEAALIGNPVADLEKPLEALRTVHSFDLCLACAIHLGDAKGREISWKKVL